MSYLLFQVLLCLSVSVLHHSAVCWLECQILLVSLSVFCLLANVRGQVSTLDHVTSSGEANMTSTPGPLTPSSRLTR